VGRAICESLVGNGARVVVHSHGSAEAARELVDGWRSGQGVAVIGDLRSNSASDLIARCAARGFEPDVLVHSAASFLRKPVLETSAVEWDEVHALNLRAFFLLGTEIARRRGDRGGDLIAIVDSAAVELWPEHVVHSVSKAALQSLVQALAKALAPAFRVNGVMPGPVLPPEETSADDRTRMARRTLLGRLGDPQHVAQAVLFLLRCDYATGATIRVTGGSDLQRWGGEE
jgi:NAD(P)-dependent dehydrogenase (short-subunit alcohol dehydrogenase family)